MSISRATAKKVAQIVLENSKSRDHAMQIMAALRQIPGNKSYHEATWLVLTILAEEEV